MIPLRDQEYLRERFARELTGAVRIDLFTQRRLPIFIPGREECAFCEETQQLLKELSALSDKIRLTVHEFSEAAQEAARLGVDRVPGIVLRGALNRPIRFFGLPGGHEFPAFVEGVIDVSRGKVDLATETARQLKRLKSDVSLEAFVTPTCPSCPAMARLAHKLALESPRVRADVIEIMEFPRLIERHNISAVPVTVIGGRVALVGAMSEQTLMAQIMQFAQRKALQPAAGALGPTSPVEQQRPQERRESGIILPG
ncbi:MAG: thioredoxin family protein [Dehalococcoidia bacterium]|nr:thioredoxin family protein [Dehalococcoidia bacterium]